MSSSNAMSAYRGPGFQPVLPKQQLVPGLPTSAPKKVKAGEAEAEMEQRIRMEVEERLKADMEERIKAEVERRMAAASSGGGGGKEAATVEGRSVEFSEL